MNRYSQPAERVHEALARMSRDKWLPPSEVLRIGMSLANKCSLNPGHTFRAAAGYGRYTGMIAGRAVACLGDETYSEAIALAKKYDIEDRADARAEIEIIKLKARQYEYYRRSP